MQNAHHVQCLTLVKFDWINSHKAKQAHTLKSVKINQTQLLCLSVWCLIKSWQKDLTKYLYSYRSNMAVIVTIVVKGQKPWPLRLLSTEEIQDEYCPFSKACWWCPMMTLVETDWQPLIFSSSIGLSLIPVHLGPWCWGHFILLRVIWTEGDPDYTIDISRLWYNQPIWN